MELTLPLKVRAGSKKKKPFYFSLNLNTYRNEHYAVLNRAKIQYKKDMLLMNFKTIKSATPYVCGPLFLEYKLFMPSKRKCDVANILSIVDKFACDALVEYGILPDDNYDFIKEIHYIWGGVDKGNPRAELYIDYIIDHHLNQNQGRFNE